MGNTRRLALILALVLGCAGCDWSQWGAGPSHSGDAFEPGLSSSTVPALVASPVSTVAPTGQAVVTNGLVFVQQDGKLFVFDAATSALVWTAALPAGSTVGGVPAVDPQSGTVFVVVATSSHPVLEGFDVNGTRNCDLFLETCLPVFYADLGNVPGPATPPAVSDGRVFVNGAGSVFSFDAAGRTNCLPFVGAQICLPLWSAATAFSAAGVGPSVDGGAVYDAVQGSTFGVRALNESTGATMWTGSLASAPTATPSVTAGQVFAPAGTTVAAFAHNGCGGATCAASFSLVGSNGDPAGTFDATPASDGNRVFATNTNGTLYEWSATGCGQSTCQPGARDAVHVPGTAAYSQSPSIATGGVVFVLAEAVDGTRHVALVALDPTNLTELRRWDLGATTLGPGLSSASIAQGVVYAPTANGISAVHAPPVQPLASMTVSPLTLSPAFSPGIFDYIVPCAAGTNSLTLNVAAVPGGSVRVVAPITTSPSAAQSDPVSLGENQAAVVQAADAQGSAVQYWIRCLPHDFPAINVTTHPAAGTATPGWYLTTNLGSANTSSYAMILDGHGTPVWYRKAAQGAAINSTLMGNDTIAYMSTAVLGGFGTDPNAAFDVFNLDTNQKVASIATVGGVPTDDHELRPMPNGDRLVLSYVLKSGFDLTGIGGDSTPRPDSTIADCEVQELNPQGQLVWKWDASDHIDPVTENTFYGTSTINGQTVYDVYHCNSVDPIPGGDVLVSFRHLSAVYRIGRSDGKIVWKLGGKPVSKDNAQIITITNYAPGSIGGQHDARFLPNGDISLFDDQTFSPGGGFGVGPAQGVEFSLNLTAGTASPVFQFPSPSNIDSLATGSFRRDQDGDSVACWGYTSFSGPNTGGLFSESNAAGADVLDVAFADGEAGYRVVKVPPARFNVNVLRATAGQ